MSEQIISIRKANKSRRVQTKILGKSKTVQSQKKETEIQNIIHRYKTTGQFTHVRDSLPQYGDASTVTDYKSAMDSVQQAQNAFSELPSEIRNRFENDPGKLIEFLADQKNLNEAIELGLVEKPALDLSSSNNAADTAAVDEPAASDASST